MMYKYFCVMILNLHGDFLIPLQSITQDIELQKEALEKAGCQKIFSESVSGKDNNRTQLKAMIELLREGDIVVVYKIDRIARSLKGLIGVLSFKYS